MKPHEPVRAATARAQAALFFGNIMIGAGVLAPAAMINDMTRSLKVAPSDIGALIGWGALVLFVGAPTLAFLTNRLGRRALLAASCLLYAIGHAASALASDYGSLMTIRLLMISAAAVFTPQAASCIAMIAPEKDRAGAVALVFMGWTVASAAVSPLMSLLSEMFGWRTICWGIAAGAGLATAAVGAVIPRGLFAQPLDLRAWGDVFRRPAIPLLLATTALLMAGQFVLFPYLAAELRHVTGAGPAAIAVILALFGTAGLAGTGLAARHVGRLGPGGVHVACLIAMIAGIAGWSLVAGFLVPAACSVALWGLGFGAAVSMQQARLIAVAPLLASASVAMNTSFLYLGQAGGAAIGGVLMDEGAGRFLGPVAAALLALALGLSWSVRRLYRS
jgi:predicted MFS family arabinose efflux permease